jgi:predicted Zn-dependent peptidase
MEVLSDLFFESVLDAKELKKEQKVVLEEIDMVDDTPDENVMEMVIEAYYGKHALGKPILGNKKNVSGFKSKDLREYMNRFYAADNVVVSIAGHIKPEEADRLIVKYFAERFSDGSCKCPPPERHVLARPVSVSKHKDIEQANIAFAFPCYEFNHKKEAALYAFNNIFGGGMSSRLFQRIREQMGLAYSVYSYASTYENDGVLMIYLATNPAEAASAKSAVLETIDDLIKNGITDREFLSGKEQIKGGLVLGQESSSAIMKINGKYLLGAGLLFDFDAFFDSIKTMKKDDVLEAAAYSLDVNKMATAYLGKKNKK